MDLTSPSDADRIGEDGAQEGVPPKAPEIRPGQRGDPKQDRRLLGGLQGSLPAEGLIAKGQTIISRGDEPARAKSTAQSRLLAEIVSRPLDLRRQISDITTESRRTRLAWWFAYAALILVVALPLGLGRPLLWRVVQPSLAASDLYAAIEALPAGAAALVAFDYDPAAGGEMDIIARSIVRHLMDREVRIVAVSLVPAGPATAQNLLALLAVKRPGYRGGYGTHYANLGFVPGQAAAVRLLGASTSAAVPRDFRGIPLKELPVMDGLYSLRSFDLVVELAASPDTLRWWVEQAASPLGISLGAGVSASVAPLAQPYYEARAGQLAGMVAGATDAFMYESRSKGEQWVRGYNAARLDAQFWGHMFLVALILIGGVVFFARDRNRRRGP